MDKNFNLGPVTIKLTGENRISSADDSGISSYINYHYKALPRLIITGDTLEADGYWHGFDLSGCGMEMRNAAVKARSQRERESNDFYGINLTSSGTLSIENGTVQANRILVKTLDANNSQLTAFAEGGGYSRKIIAADNFTFTGGKLTVYGPEGLNNHAVYSGSYDGGTHISLSNCEIDIHDVEQGIRIVTGDIHLDNVTGTVLTAKSSASNSIYENNAFDDVSEGTCTNCHIFAQTGKARSVVNTFVYGDCLLVGEAGALSETTGLYIQAGCAFTIDKSQYLTLTENYVTFHDTIQATVINNGILEFFNPPVIRTKLVNNGTLLVNGHLNCDPSGFENNGTFDQIIGDTDQYLYGEQELEYDRYLGKPTSVHRWAYKIHVTEDAVLTIPSGITLDASQSEKGITSDTLQDYLTAAESGKLAVAEGGRLLLPAGLTQA